MHKLIRAALALLAALACAPAFAATTATVPLPQCQNSAGQYVPCQGAVTIDPATGNPIPPGALPASTASPLVGAFTTTSVTPANGGGAATLSGGVITAGPFAPQLGRDLRVRITGSGSAQLFTTRTDCTALTPLTVAGATWAQWSALPVNEVPDTPTTAGDLYCLQITPTAAGTYEVR